ncbi:RNA polymerase recycling motor HelD [Halobacillus trueperi]|uniref:DNA 3'-5' helicase n=1 Tax=Halobacillus trueperi TaxID=156205 RepID=A0A3E0J2R8_9BACI|nr:RNA polymerase recycling motor HelD [Halobacillus trueperi]REJ07151.1 DNA helicase [Halobacillus trueperi]
MVTEHPDYEQEKERLTYTKHYMEEILTAAEGKHEDFKGNIKEAFENLDYLDSSLSYINILVNAKFIEMNTADIEHLKRVESKPYFARIDFKNKESGEHDSYYIGKVSLFRKDTQESLIVDWRSPVANLYYDGRLGEVEYETEDGEVAGNLTLKRQYVIEEGKLEEIRDIDITTRDELLQDSLSGTADNRLNEIVSTIQAEQNEVIRSDLSKPVIVQGVAGSGKTTIALHRISMFIYTFAENTSPEEMMILAPNDLFIDYISQALPDLGVDQIKQTTFTEYVRKSIGKKVKIVHPDQKFLQILEHETEEELLEWASHFKGTFSFKTLIDRYLADVEKTYRVNDDFKVEGFTIYKAKNVNRLFFEDYHYLPLENRVKKVKNVLQANFKKKKKEMIKVIEQKFEDRFDQLYYSMKQTEERRKRVVHLNDQKEKKIDRIKKTTNKVVTEYMKQYPKVDVFQAYHELMSEKDQLLHYSNGELTKQQAAYLAETFQERRKKNQYELEDLAPLLYIHTQLKGMKKKWQAKNVVIDEAQDYSVFQFYALKQAAGTDLFTLLGDLSQGIHAYRGIESWQEVMDEVFPKASYRTLKKSYRTTVEVMNLANDLLGVHLPHLDSAEPVVRHGSKPKFLPLQKEADAPALITSEIQSIMEKGMKSIALLTKTMKEAKELAELMKATSYECQLLEETQQLTQGKIAIVPSYLAKGLEFDAVILVNAKDHYTDHEIDIKLLYVAMTRPLHYLSMIGPSEDSFQLNPLNRTLFQTEQG